MGTPSSRDDASLRALLASSYGISEAATVELSARTASWVARVSSGEQRWWLRLERTAYRGVEQVELEGELATRLGNAGCSVAAAVRRGDGSFASTVAIEGEAFGGILYEEAAGASVAAPTEAQAHALGRALALLHQHGDSSLARRRLVIDMSYLVHEPLRALAAKVPRDWCEHDGLEMLSARLGTMVWSQLVPPLAAGFCHGDVHLDNVCFSGDTATLIDLGECGYGPSALDLACYWRKRILAGAEGAAWRAEWRAVLEGYGSVRVLEVHELRAIPALAVLRAVRTMGMPALPGCGAWGSAWLQDRGYLQAHLERVDRLVGAAGTQSNRP